MKTVMDLTFFALHADDLQDAIEIIGAVIFDFEPASFFPMVKGHVSAEVALELGLDL